MPSDLHLYPIHYKSAFAFLDILFLQSIHAPYDALTFIAKGALQSCHVPPIEHIDLAACCRPEGIVDDEEFAPRIPPPFSGYGLTVVFHSWR